MGTARFAATGKRRALTAMLALTLVGAAATPVAPLGIGRAAAQSGSAIVAHSDDGVLLRAEPAYGAEVVGTLAEGTVVSLRTEEVDTVYDPDGTTRWWPVRTDIGDGWIAGFYLQIVDYPHGPDEGAAPAADEPAAESAAPPPAEAAADAATDAGTVQGGTSARVADPEGVNLRAEPSAASEALASLAVDRVVELRIDEADTVYADGGRWWPVRVDGVDGWILGAYLAPADAPAVDAPPADAPPADAPAEEPAAPDPAPVARLAPGSYAAVVTDDGTGLNIRADGAPDAERVGSIPETDVVQVMDGPFLDPTGAGWYLVTDGEVTGYVDGAWLVEADQPEPPDGAPAPEPAISEPAGMDPVGVASGSFIYPVEGFTFTQSYGCSPYWFEPWEPAAGCNFHNGIDLANSSGTPLLAADGGVVEYAGWCDCGLGYYVKIDHGNGFKTVYGHMSEIWVGAGEALRQGDVIGAIGSTGNSTGPHVHFMIEADGVTVDPLAFL